MRGFFITATDTDRGKTLFTAALRLWLQRRGLSCLAMKPVQTGMEQCRLSPDLHRIYALDYERPNEEQIYHNLLPILPLLQPYCYRDPCSPHLAAERDNLEPVALLHIKNCVCGLQESDRCSDVLLVEGAGGIFVPIDRQSHLTVGDIAQSIGLPVILVAQSGLGAINATCLSIMAIKNFGLPIAGFVLNNFSLPLCPAYIREDNPKIIAELTSVPYLGTLPFIANPQNGEELRRSFETLCGLRHLKKYLDSENCH